MSVGFSERNMSLEYYFGRGSNADMSKYDADGDGVVDNAARLGGYAPSHFASAALVAGARVRDVTLDENGALVLLLEDGTRFVTDRVRGADGKDGIDGIDGRDGIDGHTPQKGVDYFTEADVAEIVARVLAALPVTPDVPDTVTISEYELGIGTRGEFLRDGVAYLVNGNYFVATANTPSSYIAPPEGTVITTEVNVGTVCWNGSNWYVRWRDAPDETRRVTFAETELRPEEEDPFVKGEVVAVLTESDLASGTDGAFLEEGCAYFVGDVRFVAVVEGEGYLAPPCDIIIETEANRGYICTNATNWTVAWDNAPSEERSVTFYRAVEVTP